MVYDYSKGKHFIAYDTAAGTASNTRQVVMLYDGIIRFVLQARDASLNKKYQDVFNALDRAGRVIIGLQACLDHTNGKDVATTLDRYYTIMYARLMELVSTRDPAAFDIIADELRQMRDAWEYVDQEHNKSASENGQEGKAIDQNIAANDAEGQPPSGLSVSV